MYSFALNRCPLDLDHIASLLKSLSADASTDDKGHTVVTFDQSLGTGTVMESVSLLKEYFRAVKRKDERLFNSIDTEQGEEGLYSAGEFRLESFGAFGSGNHGTTRGCMDLLEECLKDRERIYSLRYLDLGTGTGVLALSAFFRGIRDITAADISMRAVIAAFHNFRINGIHNCVRLVHGSVDNIPGFYDVVSANIRTPVLEKLFDRIVKRTSVKGWIIFSGIKEEEGFRIDRLVAKKRSLEEKKKIIIDGWISCLLYKIPNEEYEQ